MKDITLADLEPSSPPGRAVTGGVSVRDGANITVENVAVRHFRWNGLRTEFSTGVTVANCVVEDSSRESNHGGTEGGLVRTRWLEQSRFGHSRVVSTGTGYGYKGGGHVGVRLDHNVIKTGHLTVKSVHESEYGLEIDHNYLTRCISAPKPGPGDDPESKGHTYAVHVHDNLSTDSYAVEGPRNHLRVDHNFVRVESPGGRIYARHGGVNHGPVWIDHNVVEGADLGFVYMNEGLAENVMAANYTVTVSATKDAGPVLSAWSAERLTGWAATNNVFVAPPGRPRALMPAERVVAGKITAANNIGVNVSGLPAAGPLFAGAGPEPWAYYAPAAGSPAAGPGVKVGTPFWNAADPAGAPAYLGAVGPGPARV